MAKTSSSLMLVFKVVLTLPCKTGEITSSTDAANFRVDPASFESCQFVQQELDVAPYLAPRMWYLDLASPINFRPRILLIFVKSMEAAGNHFSNLYAAI